MPDEPITAEVPQTVDVVPEVAPPTETPTPEPPPAAVTPSWQEILETVDPKELRKHPRFAGTLGPEIQRAVQAREQQIKIEEQAIAARAAEENLRKLAQEDPVTFAEQWLSQTEQDNIRQQMSNIHGQAKHEIAVSIGQAYQNIPEWSDLTEADHESLASALAGKSENEVIPIFNQKALELIADKKATKLFSAWKDRELPKVREAIRQEEAAKLLTTSVAPDVTSPKNTPGMIDIHGMSDDEFNKFWQR